ncbi:MAG: imidazoleglycerol-phosphate dehydratase [Desulfovibrio sp.]|jgi:imidazoleglycerol-phosphate dehydratase|nr:imidazoleglycerol-phosphate dehydratase [Desulfovibrio sp.]
MRGNKNPERRAEIRRETGETSVGLILRIDGSGKTDIDSGFGMADHLLTLIAVWAGFDLDLKCRGDLYVDAHHSVEDIGLCLGRALDQALGDRKGLARSASAAVPMDEALAGVCVDLSGRPFLVCRGRELLPPVIAGQESDLWREFFNALAVGAKMNLHITFAYGDNGHHLLESAGKGLGLALKAAVTHTRTGILSTKGSLDL